MPSEGEKSPEAENNNKKNKTGASQVKCLKNRGKQERAREVAKITYMYSRWDRFFIKIYFRGS